MLLDSICGIGFEHFLPGLLLLISKIALIRIFFFAAANPFLNLNFVVSINIFIKSTDFRLQIKNELVQKFGDLEEKFLPGYFQVIQLLGKWQFGLVRKFV